MTRMIILRVDATLFFDLITLEIRIYIFVTTFILFFSFLFCINNIIAFRIKSSKNLKLIYNQLFLEQIL